MTLKRRPTARKDLVRRDLVHLSSRRSPSRPQEPVRGTNDSMHAETSKELPADTGRRLPSCRSSPHSYVVLAADFEEAWKQVVKRSDDRPEFCAFTCLFGLLSYALRGLPFDLRAFSHRPMRHLYIPSFGLQTFIHSLPCPTSPSLFCEKTSSHTGRDLSLISERVCFQRVLSERHNDPCTRRTQCNFKRYKQYLKRRRAVDITETGVGAASRPLPTLTSRFLFLPDFLQCLGGSQKKVASWRMTLEATEEMRFGAPPRFEQFGRAAGGQNPSPDDDIRSPAIVDRFLDPGDVGGRGSGRLRFARF